MKKIFFALLIAATAEAASQSLYFPPNAGNSWDTLSPASLGWCTDQQDELLNYLGAKNSKAFILLKDGKIVIEKYYGTFTADSVWYWASAGKTLTAFTTGIAQQEGYLAITDTTSDYLGNGWIACALPQEEKITVRHQLTMTTGLDDGVPDHHCTLDTCLQYLADAGTRWAYHNGPYTLLDDVINAATGQSLNAYFTQKVKNPTGMTGLFLPIGYNNVYYSNARSMARFGLLMLNGGNWNGNPVMTDTAYFNAMISSSQGLNEAYGYLWWLNGKQSYMVPGLQFQFNGSLNPNAPDDMVAALGKNGQIINVVNSLGLVYIRMGNSPGAGEVPWLMNDTIWQKLNALMCNVGLEEVNPGPQIRVHPVPAQGTFHFEAETGISEYCLVNAMGQRVLSARIAGETNGATVDVSALQPGVYTLMAITKAKKILTSKLVITGN